jgi:hypothetical protein
MSTTTKLRAVNKYHEYDKVFEDWLKEDFIEIVDEAEEKKLCYRAVFKPHSQTTPVRPVFDASCKTGRAPSLNQCMEKGPNLLELIPSILLRFREKNIGVTADIRKAFQMIEIEEREEISSCFCGGRTMQKKSFGFSVTEELFLASTVVHFC